MIDVFFRSATALLEPIGFIWFLVIIGAVLAGRQRRWRLAAYLAVIAGLMTLFGGTPLAGAILASLERPFVRPDWREVPAGDAIVVLGGEVQPSRHEAFGLDFSPAADRAIMGLELLRLGKGATLVLSGSAVEDQGQLHVESDLMTNWLAAWKLTTAPIVSLGKCENTHDEALKIQALAKERGWKKIILVTSAYHLRRARATFLTAGLDVECVACDFKTSVSVEGDSKFGLVPRYPGFVKLSYFAHEEIGWLMYRWRGWINAEAARG